jgi:hypothetical protein
MVHPVSADITDLLKRRDEQRAAARAIERADASRSAPARSYAGTDHPWVVAGLENTCREIAATPEGGRDDALNAAAYRFAGFAAAGHIGEQLVYDSLYAAGLDSGQSVAEVERALRPNGALKDGRSEPRDPPESNAHGDTTDAFVRGHMSNGQAASPEAPTADVVSPGESSWRPVDVSAVVDGLLAGTLDRPRPTLGALDGGGHLFYPGRVNGIAGDSGSGKTWTALVIAGQLVADQAAVIVYIDLEDDEAGMIGRLLDLGADPDAVRARFVYLSPVERFDAIARAVFGEVLDERRPHLVVVDSTGEALSLEGANPNADEEVARWFRLLPRWIATRFGAAVLVLDHMVKNGEGGLWPIGSQRKRAAITGAQYVQETIRPFAKDAAGHAVLKCAKDRHGTYRPGQRVAELHVEPLGDGRVHASLRPAEEAAKTDGRGFRPTTLMERVSVALLLAGQPLSFNGIDERVTGKRQHLRVAVDVLIAEAFVTTEPGPRGPLHTSRRPYRASEDGGEPVSPEVSPEVGPTGSGSLGGEPGTSRLTGSREPLGTTRNHSACAGCGEPMTDLGDGAATHPACGTA